MKNIRCILFFQKKCSRGHDGRAIGLLVLMIAFCLPAKTLAQPPANNPNEMCGDGTTFTVFLPGLNVLPLGVKAPDDSITLPNGCSIYALLVSGYERNKNFDELTFYKLAKFVSENNGYVHYAWWNNILKEYMAGAAHDISVTIPLLGTFNANPGGLIGVHAVGFVPLNFITATTLFPKAIPEEDKQFQADAKLLLQAIRAHNPDAIIIVAGHSMGGEAVARLGTDKDVDIDLLAPTDAVGNRTRPVGQTTNHTYNWTRWRAAQSVWGGFRRADCIRTGPFPSSCRDFDPRLFHISYRCEPEGVGPWLDEPPVIGSLAPLICPGPILDPGLRRTIHSNVRHLMYRWQKETLFPFDFNSDEPFKYQGTDTVTTSGQVIPAQRALGENGLLESDPQKTCSNVLSADPRDPTLNCNPSDGHGEIVGFRGLSAQAGGAIPVGLQAQNWPTTAAGRRLALIEMTTAPDVDPNKISTDPPAWQHEPLNPNLCMVSDEMIQIVQTILDQQQAGSNPDDTTPPVTVAELTPGSNAAGWNNMDVDVSLSSADEPEGSGVMEIQHTLTGAQSGTFVTPGDMAEDTITAEGTTTILFLATDNAGNMEAENSVDVKVDKTPPDIAAASNPPANANSWNNTDVLVSFPASDEFDGSGLASSTPDVLVSEEGTNQEIIGNAEDNAGNQAAASAILNIDKTAPTIPIVSFNPAANSNGWNNSDVTLKWLCVDSLSGPVSSSAVQILTTEGADQSATGTCVDLAGNTTSQTESGIKIDKTDPVVHIVTPRDGAAYLLNAAIHADYSCADNLSGINSCNGPVTSGAAVDTSPVGSHTFAVNGFDNADNTGSSTHTYEVHYGFSGFGNPVAPVPMVNMAKAGQTVPIKYTLQNATGTFISDPSTFVSLMSAPVSCNSNAPGGPAENADSAGHSTLHYDTGSGQFVYNWKTMKSWTGSCRILTLRLNDGTEHLALFKFK